MTFEDRAEESVLSCYYGPAVQVKVVTELTTGLSQKPLNYAHLMWLMEILSCGCGLGPTEHKVVKNCLNIYADWFKADEEWANKLGLVEYQTFLKVSFFLLEEVC